MHVCRVSFLTDVAAFLRAHSIQLIQIQVSGDLVLQSIVTSLVIHRQNVRAPHAVDQFIALEERCQLRRGRRSALGNPRTAYLRFQVGTEYVALLISRIRKTRESVLHLSDDPIHLHRLRNRKLHLSSKHGHRQHLSHIYYRRTTKTPYWEGSSLERPRRPYPFHRCERMSQKRAFPRKNDHTPSPTLGFMKTE